MMFFWCFGLGAKTKKNPNQKKLKEKSDKKCKRDQPSSSLVARPDSQTQQNAENLPCKNFTYEELAIATNNFKRESLVGRGGFGAVHKGKLESTGQEVAVKTLDEYGGQGKKEFLVEVLMLSMLHHKNIIKLSGYCNEGEYRIVVYEYMPRRSLEDHLHKLKPGQVGLNWYTRMKIALGAAKGLDYLHNKVKPPVIYRDLKSGNILLDSDYEPKLSDFGLAMFAPVGDQTHVRTTRVMGTTGYCAPEYLSTGKVTTKCDIYSFGVVLLELITGREACADSSYRGPNHPILVKWALPLYQGRNIKQLLDPRISIQGDFMETTVKKAVQVAFSCVREHANYRPLISEVVTDLTRIVDCLEWTGERG